ncbi:MAG: hypothetical protein IKQ71_07035 [Lachnospiraceae bacterium]|nr:hypothetical protein [Lachnospiraceae bacterium]
MQKDLKLFILAMITVLAVVLIPGFGVEAEAALTTRTTPFVLTGNTSNVDSKSETEGWEWKASEKQLILEDGFKLNYTDGDEAAMTLKAGTTIVLKGTATITSNNTGIDAKGDLFIKSEAKKVTGETETPTYGTLKVNCTSFGYFSTCYYGIRIENECCLNVSDDAVLDVSGGNGCLFASSDKGAFLDVGTKGAVYLTNDSKVGDTQNTVVLKSKSNRVIFDATNKNNSFAYLVKEETRNITNQKYIKILACEIESDYKDDMSAKRNNDKGTDATNKDKYELTYDGKEHKVLVNTSELGNLELTPTNFNYNETDNSEYLEDDELDYRDKRAVETTTTYQKFTEDIKNPKEAAVYKITYRGTSKQLATFEIKKRQVYITGLKALNKTYDGWDDAPIDYSGLTPDENKKIANIVCINDYNGNTVDAQKKPIADATGIPEDDIEKLGVEIIPYAKAYFLTDKLEGAAANCTINATGYKYSKDVAYVNDKVENGIVETKKVYIKDVYLSDPNYDVQQPMNNMTVDDDGIENYATNKKSQAYSTAKIYPRNLTDDRYISCKVNPTEKTWSKSTSGDSIWKIVDKYVYDTAHTSLLGQIPTGYGYPAVNTETNISTATLTYLKDYTISTNSYSEIGKQIVLFSGRGNYTGSITASWLLKKAKREIFFAEQNNRGYDGTRYRILNDITDNMAQTSLASGTNMDTAVEASDAFKAQQFAYMVIATTGGADGITPTKENVTPTDETKPEETLEANCGFDITYEGTGSTTYPVSHDAPVDVGTYKVTIKLKETVHYLAAENSFNFEIYPRVVTLKWSAAKVDELANNADANNPAPQANPWTMTYNATPNVFTAVVTNKVKRLDATEEDVVNAIEYTYNGATASNRSTDSVAVTNLALDAENKEDATKDNATKAPKNAGNYHVNVTKLDNPNYTVAANSSNLTPTPANYYKVNPKQVGLSWTTNATNDTTLTFNNLDQTPVFTVLDLCTGEDNVKDVCTVRKDSIQYSGLDVYGDPYKNPYANEAGVFDITESRCKDDKTDKAVWLTRDPNSHKVDAADYKQDDRGAVNATKKDTELTITVTEFDNPNYKPKADDPGRIVKLKIEPLDLTTLKAAKRSMTLDDVDKPGEDVELWAQLTKYTGYWYPPILEWKKGTAGEVLQRNVADGVDGDAKADITPGRGDYTAEDYTSASDPRLEDYTIVITGINNYKGKVTLPWNVVKLKTDEETKAFTVTGVKATDETKAYEVIYKAAPNDKEVGYFAFAYDDPKKVAPIFTFDHGNRDILRDNVHDISYYTRYEYEGVMANGREYKSSQMPTQAGAYIVTIKLIETDHYVEQETKVVMEIKPKKITVASGVKGVDKPYDGTSKATLNFQEIEFAGLLDVDANEDGKSDDEEAMKTIFEGEASKTYITYEANFHEGENDITDVRLLPEVNTPDNIGIVCKNFKFAKDDEDNLNAPADFKLLNKDKSLDLIYNYTIDLSETAVNQSTTEAKILQRPVTVSGVKAKDRVYDGTVDVVLDTTGLKVDDVIGEDKLTAKVSGKLKQRAGEAVGAKDVLLDENGKPMPKLVEISILSIDKGDATTKIDNYCIGLTDGKQFVETTVIITPATFKITGVKADDKVYDGTTAATGIDWTDMKIEGACTGDFIILKDDTVFPTTGDFDTPDVAYDKKGNVVAKPITVIGFNPEFKEGYIKSDYIYEGVEVFGTILPKEVEVKNENISWTFNEEKQIPEAKYTGSNEVGVAIVYYDANDTEFKLPLTEDELKEDKAYVARIETLDSSNYGFTAGSTYPTYQFVYDKIKKEEPKTDDSGSGNGSENQSGNDNKDQGNKDNTPVTPVTPAPPVTPVTPVTPTTPVVPQTQPAPVVIDDIKETPAPAVDTTKAAEEAKALEINTANALNAGATLSYKDKKLTFTWGKVKEADGYYVYINYLGKKFGKRVATITTNKTTQYTVKRKAVSKKYKAYVKAYKVVDGKKVFIGKSYTLKCAGSKIKNYNAKKINGCPKTLVLSATGTYNISAKVVLTNGTVKTGTKAYLTYWSTNTEIAKVSKKGIITAQKKGTCYIYIMARNGLKKKIKVTVG